MLICALMVSFILERVACQSRSRSFSISNLFQHLLRSVSSVCVCRSRDVSIGTWSDNCAISSLVVYLISLSPSVYEINARSIVLWVPLDLHVTAPHLVTSSSDALRAISSSISAAACCVGRAKPAQNRII
jgi:hypothetical protein